MARLISVPGLASLVIVSRVTEIDSLIDHPLLDRVFVAEGRLANRLLVSALGRQVRQGGEPLDAFRSRDDAHRRERQRELFARLDEYAESGRWPPAPLVELGRFVAEGLDRRGAEAALAYTLAAPFLGVTPTAPSDDAYKPIGRHLWRLHRRTVIARKPASISGLTFRLLGVDRRARAAILELVDGDDYGLHALEITLANARVILERMREAAGNGPLGSPLSGRELAWAAIRTAPVMVVRQSPAGETTLPHVSGRVPPRTLVLLRMREGLTSDAPSGYEFASSHWSACPARRFVMRLFEAVGKTAVDLARGGRGP